MVPGSNEIITASVWVFGDNVSSDDIIPGKRLAERDMQKLARFVFENLNEEFGKKAKQGDVIVAGRNFGCGSSREQAVLVIKALGINLIFAESFGRIFLRNAVNNGILPLKIKTPLKTLLKNGDKIQIDFGKSTIIAPNLRVEFEKPPEIFYRIWEAGGLVEYLKRL